MKHIKPILVLVMVVSFVCSGYSQELPRHVFSTGGDHYEAAAVHLSWTIGQAVAIGTPSQPTVILCSGFQQFDDQLVSIQEVGGDFEITLYPNPCNDFLRLSADFEQRTTVIYTLFDLQGRTIKKAILSGAHTYLEEIRMDDLLPGLYNIMFLIGEGDQAQLKSIKIIKD